MLLVNCLTHLVHDGLNDALNVFFPIWQAQFALTFTEVGLLRTLVSGTMASFQMPAGLAANRWGEVRMILAGTVLVSLGAIGYGFTSGLFSLAFLLALGGVGSSVQHPLASTLVTKAYPDTKERRTALGTLNFSGDIGKLTFPALAAFIIALSDWPSATRILGFISLLAAGVFYLATRGMIPDGNNSAERKASAPTGWGWCGSTPFLALLAIGIIDSATRGGFIVFFPFLLQSKGAGVLTVGLALSLTFAGGATGKFLCGMLATRLGVLKTVIVTESLTAIAIWGMVALPLDSMLVLAPILGLALNGTSSVLYGSVPELVAEEHYNQAFAFFYTLLIGAGAVSPIIFGFAGDVLGIGNALSLVGVMALLTVPLTVPLRGKVAH